MKPRKTIHCGWTGHENSAQVNCTWNEETYQAGQEEPLCRLFNLKCFKRPHLFQLEIKVPNREHHANGPLSHGSRGQGKASSAGRPHAQRCSRTPHRCLHALFAPAVLVPLRGHCQGCSLLLHRRRRPSRPSELLALPSGASCEGRRRGDAEPSRPRVFPPPLPTLLPARPAPGTALLTLELPLLLALPLQQLLQRPLGPRLLVLRALHGRPQPPGAADPRPRREAGARRASARAAPPGATSAAA